MTTQRPTPFNSPRRGLTRRQLLARAGALGAAGISLPAFLAACGSSDGDSGSAGSTPASGSTSGTSGGGGGSGSLFFENWPAYIDLTEDGATGTVDRFMEATGIDMRYTEAYNDNTEYFAKIQPILGRGETIDPDIIAPTGWMAGRLLTLGWLDKLPIDQVPNAANLRADLQGAAWDPTGEYSLPWQTGFAGIAYNIDVTGRELTSVDDLFDPEFAGKVGALTEMRDTIGLLLMAEGVNISTLTSFEEAAPAFERLEKAKADGQIRRFHGNDYFDDLSNGNFAATIGWSGDVAGLARDNPAVRFVFPESGATVVGRHDGHPEGCKERRRRRPVDEFRLRPGAGCEDHRLRAIRLAGRRRAAPSSRRSIPNLANDPLLFPDDATLAQTQTFASLPEDVEAEYDAAFSSIIGA